jgi:hypothetical protein
MPGRVLNCNTPSRIEGAPLRVVLQSAVLAALAAPALAATPTRQLTDADLVAYAAKPFDRGAMMFKHVTLGMHHGALVVADFPCGDVCPNYTVRIIHYDTPPGPACARLGGVVVSRSVPVSIAVTSQSFCVPAALGGKP